MNARVRFATQTAPNREARDIAAEHLHAARCNTEPCYNPVSQRHRLQPSVADLQAADALIAALPGGGLIVGGDYPRDLTTRALVINALVVASLIEQGGPIGVVAEQGLTGAAQDWHRAHKTKPQEG